MNRVGAKLVWSWSHDMNLFKYNCKVGDDGGRSA